MSHEIHEIGKEYFCSLCSAEACNGFYHGCMVKDGHCPEWECNGLGKLIYVGETIAPKDKP